MTRAVILHPGQELAPAGPDALAVFTDFLRLQVADGDASPETVRSYRSQVAQFASWCQGQGIEPGRASEGDLQEYRRHLVEHGYQRGTIATKLAAVRRFYEAATWRGLRSDNPASGLKAPRELTDRSDRIKYLPLAGLLRLLDAPMSARDRAMLYLMGGHGLRVSEVAGLELSALDQEARTLRVVGKGSKARTIHLTEHTEDLLRLALQERRAADGVTALFVAQDHRTRGHGLTARAIRHRVDGYLLAAGLKQAGVSCHSLRHSFATWSLAAGAELRAIGAKMGHASTTTTEVYAKITDAIAKNPTTRLEALLFADRAPAGGCITP